MKERELLKKAVHQEMPDARSIVREAGGVSGRRPLALTRKQKSAWAGLAAAAVALVLLASALPGFISGSKDQLSVPSYVTAEGQGGAGPLDGSGSGIAEPGAIMPGEGNPELETKYAALEPAASRLMTRFETEGYPDFVGGLYFSEEPTLVVTLTENTAANRQWVTDLAQFDEIIFEEADYSYNELAAVQRGIDSGIADGSLPFVLSSGINVMTARLEVAVNSVEEADLLKLAALDTAGRGNALSVIFREDLAEVYDGLAAE